MKGRYADCGKGFSRIGRSLGRQIHGKPFLLHYDQEYREDDRLRGLACRSGPARRSRGFRRGTPRRPARAAGAPGTLRRARPVLPGSSGHIHGRATRSRRLLEIYLKGPGIFKGNPRNYLTEIQMFIN